MKAWYLLAALVILNSCSKTEVEPDEIVISGYVYDVENNQPVKDAKILVAEQHFLNGNNSSEYILKATTDAKGNFSLPVKKKSFINYIISPPAHFDQHGCFNYSNSCGKPDADKVYEFGLNPAAMLKMNVYSSNSKLKSLSGRGRDPIFLGDFMQDTIFYYKIKPDHEYQLKWYVYETGVDAQTYYYVSPQELNFSVQKFDTIDFYIFF